MLLKRGRQGKAKKSRPAQRWSWQGGRSEVPGRGVALGARGRRSGQQGAKLGPPPMAVALGRLETEPG